MNKHKEDFSLLCSDKLKTVHIDTYSISPYMLFARTVEKDVKIILENGRFIIKRNDKYNTTVMNIVISNVENFVVQKYGEHNKELLFNIHNIHFKIFAVFS